MTTDVRDTLDIYERMAYDVVLERYNEAGEPMIAKEVFKVMEGKGYRKSLRTFKKILSSLRKQQLVEGKLVTSGDYRGVMGYVPSSDSMDDARTIERKEIPGWKIELVTRILGDDEMPDNVRELAAYRLRDYCGHDTSIDSAGNKMLREFFSTLLNKPRYDDKASVQLWVAFDEFIRSHMSDELDWILDNYYERLLVLFETQKYVELRRRTLRCLGDIFHICQKSENAKAKQLQELFMNAFFDPHEGEKIGEVAFENMRVWGDETTLQEFIGKLYEQMETGNEPVKTRCLRCLERKILPII